MGAPPGERHGRAKMTEAKVRKLRQRYAAGGISMLALACEYDIAFSTCRAIIHRWTWKHVEDAPVSAAKVAA
jgi:hypothetical protein